MFYTLFYKNTCNIIKHGDHWSNITQSYEKREYLNNFSLLDNKTPNLFAYLLKNKLMKIVYSKEN